MRRGDREAAVGQVVAVTGASGLQETADLGGDRVLLAGHAAQHGAEPAFGQAEAVVRGGVEVPDTALPGGDDGFLGLGVGDRGEQIADHRRAEGEFTDPHRPGPEHVLAHCHGFTPDRRRRPAMPPSTARAVPVTEAAAGEAR